MDIPYHVSFKLKKATRKQRLAAAASLRKTKAEATERVKHRARYLLEQARAAVRELTSDAETAGMNRADLVRDLVAIAMEAF